MLFVGLLSNAQIINIPDANFKAKLLAANTQNCYTGCIRLDANNNGEIEQSEALLIDTISLYGANISSVIGLEYFRNLLDLGLGQNNLSTINLSTLTQLQNLLLDNNPLTSLSLAGLVELKYLSVGGGGSSINQLNFSGLVNLLSVNCSFNNLSSLDFSENTLFNELGCKNNGALRSIIIKNGRTHNFGQASIPWTDCWATGNPNLTTICADANEVTSLQTFLNNCGTTQAINIVTNCALDNENFSENKFVLLPNPTKDLVYFDNSKNAFELVTVHNSLGQQVLNQKLNDSENEVVSLQNLPLGIYFFRFEKGNEVKTLKVVKE